MRSCGAWALSVMTAIMGHMAISTDMLAAYAIMGNIDKFSTVACFGVAGATAVIVGKRIGEGADREEVYSLGCCLLAVSFGVGLVVSVCLAVLLPTVFIPYLYPLFHLEGLALEIAITMCVIYLFMLPLKSFDINNITGLLRAGGDSRMASIIDLSCQWVIAVPSDLPDGPGVPRAGGGGVPVHPVGKRVQVPLGPAAAAEPEVDQQRDGRGTHDGEPLPLSRLRRPPGPGGAAPTAVRAATATTSPGRATPTCCRPIKSTPPPREMTGAWPLPGGNFSPKGIMRRF